MTHKVRKPIYCDLCSCFCGIFPEKLFTCELASAIFSVISSYERCLYGRREHDSCLVIILFRVSRSCDAKPKLPFMKSSVFSGRFTPARLKTKSASLQYSSSCSLVESISYSYISSTEIFGLVRFCYL